MSKTIVLGWVSDSVDHRNECMAAVWKLDANNDDYREACAYAYQMKHGFRYRVFVFNDDNWTLKQVRETIAKGATSLLMSEEDVENLLTESADKIQRRQKR